MNRRPIILESFCVDHPDAKEENAMHEEDEDESVQISVGANGCDLCGDFPVRLESRCHTTSPLIAEMLDKETLVLKCFLPECGREVARLKVKPV